MLTFLSLNFMIYRMGVIIATFVAVLRIENCGKPHSLAQCVLYIVINNDSNVSVPDPVRG